MSEKVNVFDVQDGDSPEVIRHKQELKKALEEELKPIAKTYVKYIIITAVVSAFVGGLIGYFIGTPGGEEGKNVDVKNPRDFGETETKENIFNE